MAYIFYLDGVQLPVTPAKFQQKINGKNKTVTLINDGEINIIKSPGLTDISFEVLLPNVKYPFANYNGEFKGAEYYLLHLKSLKKSLNPFPFGITRIKPNGDYLYGTSMLVSLEDYTIIEDAEKYGFDVGVSISLKEYRDYYTKVLSVKDKNNTNTLSSSGITNTSGASASYQAGTANVSKVATIEQNRVSNKVTASTHTVKNGETLWAICQKELGDGSKYAEIAKLNNISNPNLIRVGQVIKLG